MDPTTTIFLVLLAIAIEAFFSGSEIGMVSVNRIKMQKLAEEGNSSAKAILKLLDNPEMLFTTTSLGTNLAMVTSTAISTAFMVKNFGEFEEWMAMLIVFPLVFFWWRNHPKSNIPKPCRQLDANNDLSLKPFSQLYGALYKMAISHFTAFNESRA